MQRPKKIENLKISWRTQSKFLNVKKLNVDKMCQMLEVNLLSFYLMKLVDQAREVRFLMTLRKKFLGIFRKIRRTNKMGAASHR